MVRNSIDGSFINKAFECLCALRTGCVKEEEFGYFNAFLAKVKTRLST